MHLLGITNSADGWVKLESIGETEEELPPTVLDSRKRRKALFDSDDEDDNEHRELLDIEPFEHIPDTLPDEQYIPEPDDDEDNEDNTKSREPLGSQPFKHPRNGSWTTKMVTVFGQLDPRVWPETNSATRQGTSTNGI